MRDPRTIIAGIGIAAMAAAGGVTRFNANGSLDTSFGSGGQAGVAGVEFFAPPMEGAQEFARAVLVQPDGKILVAGSARQGQIRFAPIQGALARFNANGTLDTSFGSGGKILSSSLPQWPSRPTGRPWSAERTSSVPAPSPWPGSIRTGPWTPASATTES
jgi:uncharacterized delta-60 repeat protein